MGADQSQDSQSGFNVEQLHELEKIIFDLNEDNIDQSVESSLQYFYSKYTYSYILLICKMVYSCYVSKRLGEPCIRYICKMTTKKEIGNKIIEVFIELLLSLNNQESNYLLEKLIENGYVEPNVSKLKRTPYFAHYMTEEELSYYQYEPRYKSFYEHIKELKANNWAYHQQLIYEGVNPNEIAKAIRNDQVEVLEKISSQPNFDFDQFIKPSIYERCSFINEGNVYLADYAAFFGSFKCFKFLLSNGSNINNSTKYAIAGGNHEIIHLCEQNHSSFENAYETAIKFHQNEVFHYIYQNKFESYFDPTHLGTVCIMYNNYGLFSFFEKNGMKINQSVVTKAIETGNIFMVQYLYGKQLIPIEFVNIPSFSGNKELFNYLVIETEHVYHFKDNIKSGFLLLNAARKGYTDIVKFLLEQRGIGINAKDKFGETSLTIASSNGYVEIVKSLLEQKGIDINAKNNDGKTALIYASRNCHIEIVKLLLAQKGIDVNAKDN